MNELEQHINSSEALYEFLKCKGKGHSYYKYYATQDRIKYILKEHSLFLSKGDTWNDLQDRSNFNPEDDSKIRFGLCMSYTKSENVAMWMLYGKNDGLMIDFGRDIVNECLETTSVDVGRFQNNEFVVVNTLEKTLFDIAVVDIVYYGLPKDGKTDSFYIKKSDNVVQNCPSQIINGISHCKKTVPWQYECECRMIVTIDKANIDINRCDSIRIKFSELKVNQLESRVFHSPNHEGNHEYEKSQLYGKIQWRI